jgi:hypothetical protein
MKIISAIITTTFAFTIEQASSISTEECHWLGGTSGQKVECLPDFYIDATCGSGSRDDCRFDRNNYSFGIHCCRANLEIRVGPKNNCHWYGGASGDDVECPPDLTPFGRCSTSQFDYYGGQCHGIISHEVECCESEIKIKEESCGWIYDTYGKNIFCPSGMIGAGFCGTNNKGDCNNGNNFIGIQCCRAG